MLYDYASKLDLAIGTDQTKVFRNRGKVHENEKWHIHVHTDQI